MARAVKSFIAFRVDDLIALREYGIDIASTV